MPTMCQESGIMDLLPGATENGQIVGPFVVYFNFTRLDMAYVVHHVDQFISLTQDIISFATKRILCYLSGTLDLGIFFHYLLKKIHYYNLF